MSLVDKDFIILYYKNIIMNIERTLERMKN